MTKTAHKILISSVLFLSSCSGVSYLAENGISQWRLFNRAKPVDQVLLSPRTGAATRRAIEIVRKAKSFAVSQGLKATSSYDNYVALDADCLLWAVSAAHPLKLEEKTWKFPIVGEVPYLGFFNKSSADKEAQRLRLSEVPNLDTWTRCVPAYSSLGWFSDPLYSSMIKGSDRNIADLVIHESLHATVWVKGSVDFNEKLANFVGLEGSLRFIEAEQGASALEQAKLEVAGEKLFGEFIKSQLQAYKEVITTEQKVQFYITLADRYQEFLQMKKNQNYKFVPLKAKLENWNNAALLTYANYYSDFSVFEALLRACDSSLSRFVSWISHEQKKGAGRLEGAPQEHLQELIQKGVSCPN